MGPNSGIAATFAGQPIPCVFHMEKGVSCIRDTHFEGDRPQYTTGKTQKSAHNQDKNRAVRAKYNADLAVVYKAGNGRVLPAPRPTGTGGLILADSEFKMKAKRR